MFQMKKAEVGFKFANFFFTSGLFIFYIYNERYPALCLQALTYQGLLFLSLYSFVTVIDIFTNRLAGLKTFLQNLAFPIALFISLLSWSLQIPVDYGGLATFKNHFFHTFNSLSCLLSMFSYQQDWEAGKLVIPFRYGLGYAILQFLLQSSGQPALYPFLDFNNNLGLAVIIVLISSILIPLIHLALCWLSEHIGKLTDKTKNKN